LIPSLFLFLFSWLLSSNQPETQFTPPYKPHFLTANPTTKRTPISNLHTLPYLPFISVQITRQPLPTPLFASFPFHTNSPAVTRQLPEINITPQYQNDYKNPYKATATISSHHNTNNSQVLTDITIPLQSYSLLQVTETYTLLQTNKRARWFHTTQTHAQTNVHKPTSLSFSKPLQQLFTSSHSITHNLFFWSPHSITPTPCIS